MKLMLKLSGEHPKLPKAEVEGVLEGEGIAFSSKYYTKDRILLVDIETKDTGFLQRLGMTLKAARYVGTLRESKIVDKSYKEIKSAKSFRVRSKSKTIENELGGRLAELGLSVNLKEPEVEVLCLNNSVGINIPLKRDFNERKPQFRPFFHPTSMHPKVARVLVNLARVKPNDVLLDPFCGTGGILIEAGLIGLKLVGRDIDPEMVDGCKKNLKYFGLSGDIEVEDALTFLSFKGKVDAIVTDPPYGRSSYVSGKDSKGLYESFLSKAHRTLEKSRCMVLVVPDKYELNFGSFDVIDSYNLRVHKSLTRRIFVLRK